MRRSRGPVAVGLVATVAVALVVACALRGRGRPRPPAPPPPAPPSPRRAGRAVVGLAALVVGVAALALAAAASDPFGVGPRLREGATAPFGDDAPSDDLAVTVAPARDLDDGDEVVVSSSAFAPFALVEVTTCLATEAYRGSGGCAGDTSSRVLADARGAFSLPYRLPRAVVVDGDRHDCAAPGDPCVVVAATFGDRQRSGRAPVGFRAGLPALAPDGEVAPRPRAGGLPGRIEPAGPVPAGGTVTVVAEGLLPGEPVLAAVCRADVATRDPRDACTPADLDAAVDALARFSFGAVPDHADATGRARVAVTVPATLTPGYALALSLDEDGEGLLAPVPACPEGTICLEGSAPPADCTEPGACVVVLAAAAELRRSAVVPVVVAG